MAELDVVAVGDVMVDVGILGSAHAARVRIRPGGSSANVAVWAAEAGARSAVAGRVGDDLAGRLVRAALDERRVEALLATDAERPTGSVVTAPEGIVVDRGATAAFAVADLPPELRAGAVVVSGYALFLPGSEEAARAALERALARWVVVDVGERAAVAELDAVAGANAVVLNEAVARALTGHGPEDAAAALGRSFALACVTRGRDGAVAFTGGELVAASAPAVEAVDPAGAGDAFAGGLFAALVRGRSLRDSLEEACRLGARAAASPDPWPARPSYV